MISPKPVLILNNVSISYASNIAVDSISFTISEGEKVYLVGKNGSGKSTLLKGILGLLPLSQGTVNLPLGKSFTAFLPQIIVEEYNFPATVWEVVLTGCQTTNSSLAFYSNKDKETALSALKDMDILDLKNHKISNLSGGQKQRTLLARCLCRNPKFLLLDEPYTGLDKEACINLDQIVDNLVKSKKLAILVASHDLDSVASEASRVLVLKNKLLFDGSVSSWLTKYRKDLPNE